ncbi:hypothetical protein [Desulfosarcina ovata]|uniref:hypothetical protein n=1 Tax=Desulfosarcina ovata TaxID=83564 RepID=UPI0012D34CEB|nr:hypothetical protein [Desulfosarcina ovata]
MVFAHQDVYFPNGWFSNLSRIIDELNKKDKKWAVLGIIGVDINGAIEGRTWSTGLRKEVGCSLTYPRLVQSIDELVIVINRIAGIVFDEKLPGFHLYGTDIVQTAILNGFSAYVIDNPVIHNSLPIIKLDNGFTKAYRYMKKKWKTILPIKSPVTTITRYGYPLFKKRIRQMLKYTDRGSFSRLADPGLKAKELGYE